jgi:hypothetical protein
MKRDTYSRLYLTLIACDVPCVSVFCQSAMKIRCLFLPIQNHPQAPRLPCLSDNHDDDRYHRTLRHSMPGISPRHLQSELSGNSARCEYSRSIASLYMDVLDCCSDHVWYVGCFLLSRSYDSLLFLCSTRMLECSDEYGARVQNSAIVPPCHGGGVAVGRYVW